MAVRLDAVDRKVLVELQKDASYSLDEIAKTIEASKTPLWSRIRRLCAAGMIKRATVELNAEASGFDAYFLCSYATLSMMLIGKVSFSLL